MKNLLFVAAPVLLILAGCAEREIVETHLKPIRSYGWPASVVDPAPDWNPASNILVVRSIGGFSMLEEGGPGERNFAADDRRESHYPRWLNRDQFVYGPGWNARRSPDGTVSTPSEGLTVVTMADGRPSSKIPLADRGYKPQKAGSAMVCAQEGKNIIFIDSKGKVSEFGEGFDASPQPDGPGLCWRDTPAFDPDWWTGRTDRGAMHVRWEAGQIVDLGDAVQAAWTRRGTVLATVRNALPKTGQPWWAGGTNIVQLDRSGAPAEVVRAGGRDPAAHPLADLMAWVGEFGGVWIGTIRPGPNAWSERISEGGSNPRWSHDGLRLAWLDAPASGSQLPAIRVAVLAVR